jgi:hypothetical protein
LLGPYRWKNRILVVYNTGDEFKKSQKEILEQDIPGLLDRDIIVLGLGGVHEPYKIVNSSDLNELKKAHEIGESSIALFGKDGTVKAIWNRTVSISELFDIIDSMPMRRREMREKRGQS